MTGRYEPLTDAELADAASSGAAGQGAIVESMRRLRVSNEKLTNRLVWLTIAVVVFTLALVFEGWFAFHR